jgi:hypothetical protein
VSDRESLLRWCKAEIEKLRNELAGIELSRDHAKLDADVRRIKKNLADLDIVLRGLSGGQKGDA